MVPGVWMSDLGRRLDGQLPAMRWTRRPIRAHGGRSTTRPDGFGIGPFPEIREEPRGGRR
jgi:hypothetical protein